MQNRITHKEMFVEALYEIMFLLMKICLIGVKLIFFAVTVLWNARRRRSKAAIRTNIFLILYHPTRMVISFFGGGWIKSKEYFKYGNECP